MTPAQIKERLQEVLAEVALARGGAEDDPMGLAEALENALEAYPPFPENAALLDGWVAEVEQILPHHEHVAQITADLAVRKAMIAVRRSDPEGALAILGAAALPDWVVPPRLRAAATRARALVRLQRLDEAEAPLKEAEALVGQLPHDLPHIRALVKIARAELALERGEASSWELAHQALLATPPDAFEDRLQVHQMLAFLCVARMDVKGALQHFQSAREIAQGCGATSELLQMLLACGSLRLSTGDVEGSNRDFDEALKLAAENPSAELLPLLKMGAARARAAAGDLQAATQEALQAAMAFAQRGSVLGYMGIIAYLHNLHLEAKEFREAYRVLATGLAVAKRLKQPAAEHLFRALVNRQRDQIMGAASFDKMVEKMIRAADPDA